MKILNTRNSPAVISYQTMRKAIGFLGIGLPFSLIIVSLFLGCDQMQPSISHYFFTAVGCLFTGVLCAVGLFLVCYKGYGPIDDKATNIAGSLAFCIAFFPTDSFMDSQCSLFEYNYSLVRIGLHYASAALFFLTLAFISFFLFTQSHGSKTIRKIMRNRIYRICAVAMIIFIVLIPISSFIPQTQPYNPTFWLECGALISFGTSWLVKAEVVLKG